MKKTFLYSTFLLLFATTGHAQLAPEITSWLLNTTATGYGGYISNYCCPR